MAISVGIAPWVADYSMARPGGAALKAAGASGVMRYLCPGRNDGVNLTAAEYQDLTANGLAVGIVCEYAADWLMGGYQTGADTAKAALPLEASLGIPRGVTYLAADWNIQPAQYQQAYACIQGAADTYGGWQYVGVYGSKAFCEWVGSGGMVKHFWSTDAWSNFVPADNASLHQHANWPADVPVVPGCDHNLILGDWAPRTATDWFDMATPEELTAIVEAAVRAVLNEGTAPGQPSWAGTSKATLAVGQAVYNAVDAVAGALHVVISGGNGHVGLDQLSAAQAELKTALAALPGGGTVDPAPIVDGVVAGVKAQFAKAAS